MATRRRRQGPAIPRQLIEYFLLGQTRRGQPERFCQDGGIVLDVWLAFAADPWAAHRVLIAPTDGVSTVHLAAGLHHALAEYRKGKKARPRPTISPLESYVAATIQLDELLDVVLPLSQWWNDKNLSALRRSAQARMNLPDALRRAIEIKLGQAQEDQLTVMRRQMVDADEGVPSPQRLKYPHWRIIDAAPLAGLIGLFDEVHRNPGFVPASLHQEEASHAQFLGWVASKAAVIAKSAVNVIARPMAPALFAHARTLVPPEPSERDGEPPPPVLVQRVFLNRRASLASLPQPGLSTIKADAATRLFNVSCKEITWAIIDAGIATEHPAFKDHSSGPLTAASGGADRPSRVRRTYDFSAIDRIRNFDLVSAFESSKDGGATVKELVDTLWALRNEPAAKEKAFRKDATQRLRQVASQLGDDLQPDWGAIEPLIRLNGDDGRTLASDHGTHVAGTLGADWRRLSPRQGDGQLEERVLLQGVCPDINLMDFRVLVPGDLEATEFALVAALEFIQWLNQRAGRNRPAVHGVNVSMSIPHEVKNYGCGATPVCVACDRLAASGAVVVAAAGNRGWNEEDLGFGNFVFCSITDPGNAQQVITVGATHCAKPHTYGVSYFSSRGPTGDGRTKPDLVAPGEKIRGPVRGLADADLDGTSMAAPFVSGAAAMLLSRHRELVGNAARVKQILLETATDLGREKYFQGHGLVDVLRALQSI